MASGIPRTNSPVFFLLYQRVFASHRTLPMDKSPRAHAHARRASNVSVISVAA